MSQSSDINGGGDINHYLVWGANCTVWTKETDRLKTKNPKRR